MLLSSLNTLVVIIAVSAFFALLRRYVPSRNEGRQLDGEELERLKKKYRNWTVYMLLLFFGFTILAGIVWFFLLCWAADIVMRPDAQVLFQIDPGHFFWCLPAGMLGIVSSSPLIEATLRRLLGERYAEYKSFTEQTSRIDGKKAYAGTAIVVVGLCLLFFVCQVGDVTRFTATGVSLGQFGRLKHPQYPYTSLQAIRFSPLIRNAAGNVLERPRYVAEFSDGTIWSTESGWRDMRPSYERKAFVYAAAQAGISIEEQ